MEFHDNTSFAKRHLEKIDSFKSERWCDSCWLLKPLCICHSLSPILTSPSVIFYLYLHYKEYKRTSNTGILLKKLFPNSEIFIFGIEEDRQKLFENVGENISSTCVLYPGEKSMELKEWVEQNTEGIKRFILLDSTWNQGRKLLNSLEEKYQRVKLTAHESSLIKCKKQVNEGFLSTLECAANILKTLGDKEGFNQVMKAFTLKDKGALKQRNKHSLLQKLEENKHYEMNN